eukprot:1194468-Prorocentrum_minimum.AAC.2
MISLNGRNPVVQVHVTSTGGMGGCGFPRRHCGPRGPTSTTWARLNQRPASKRICARGDAIGDAIQK